MTIKHRPFLFLPLLLILTVLIGCTGNPNTAAVVTGKVTYKGETLTAGVIGFYPEKGGSYTATITPDGNYEVGNLPVGAAKVTVDTEGANPDKKTPTYGGAKGAKGKMTSPPPEGINVAKGSSGKYVKIPPQYAKPDKTTLSVTLKAGKNTENIELKD
jgi:hypothetical protein